MSASFTYIELEWYANKKKTIGSWNNVPVYSISKVKYIEERDKLDVNNFYVIYDDGNDIVKDGIKYGNLTKRGDILELKKPERLSYLNEVVSKQEVATTPAINENNKLALNFEVGQEVSFEKLVDNFKIEDSIFNMDIDSILDDFTKKMGG